MSEQKWVLAKRIEPRSVEELVRNTGSEVLVTFPSPIGAGTTGPMIYVGQDSRSFLEFNEYRHSYPPTIQAYFANPDHVTFTNTGSVRFAQCYICMYTSTQNELLGEHGREADPEFVRRWDLLKRIRQSKEHTGKRWR